MKLIVGLGNPGNQYENTRHNVGFMLVDTLAANQEVSFQEKPKFSALITEVTVRGEKALLIKSQRRFIT